nr:trypsin-like serine protease [Mangrovicoccus algicola]
MLPVADHARWQAIGRLNRDGYRDRGMCTATLIGPDLVLTAAHCLRDGTGGAVRPERLRFLAGWLRGEAAAIARIASVEMAATGPAATATDRALLRLAAPVTTIRPLPLAAPDPGRPARILGYRRDRPHALSDAGDCALELLPGGTMRLGCPVTSGNSGGPVLQRGEAGWQVVGIVSATDGRETLAAPLP